MFPSGCKNTLLLLLVMAPAFLFVSLTDGKTILREDFVSLDNWEPFYFHKIKRHTVYTVEQDGGQRYLKAVSDASASALVLKKEFDVYAYPKVRWKWKTSNVYRKGDIRLKSGDDSPLRIYILFKYDPEKADLFQKIKYYFVKKGYGRYPPQSGLCYVWANMQCEEKIITSPRWSIIKMIVLESGSEHAGTWREEEINIVEDYRKAFGTDPPPLAGIAVMNDSDKTGEASTSYISSLEVFQ